MQSIFNFFSFLGKKAALFIVSMIPLIELRGSIPLGAAMKMDWFTVYAISVIGNLIPVPFLILFGKKLINWLKTTRLFSNMASRYEAKLMKKADKVTKYSIIGLCLFVALPLPGTGAWSGSALAALLDMKMKYALPSIVAGVLVAGIIMTIGSYGLLNVIWMF